MQRVFLALSLLVAMASFSRAQLSVDLVLDQEQFLRDESLQVKVQISNRSGQKVELGKDAGWLEFSIENLDGGLVSRVGDVPVDGVLNLDSAMVATRVLDLLPFYDLSKPGRYSISASVRVKNWDQEFASKRKTFDVVRGSKIWEQEFGVPSKGVPEVRKYVLQQAIYLKRLMLYVRITDGSDNKVIRVFPVGPLVSFSRPEAQIDKQSNLHVLFQSGARSFLYRVVSPDGQEVLQETYEYSPSRPTLKGSDDGKIFVSGGARRVPADVVPVAQAEAATNVVSSIKK
jgi:hypothetical protein